MENCWEISQVNFVVRLLRLERVYCRWREGVFYLLMIWERFFVRVCAPNWNKKNVDSGNCYLFMIEYQYWLPLKSFSETVTARQRHRPTRNLRKWECFMFVLWFDSKIEIRKWRVAINKRGMSEEIPPQVCFGVFFQRGIRFWIEKNE